MSGLEPPVIRLIRERGTGYVLAVRSTYTVTLPSGRRLTVKNAAGLGPVRLNCYGMWIARRDTAVPDPPYCAAGSPVALVRGPAHFNYIAAECRPQLPGRPD
jgi:hypothetical protein